MSYTMAQALYLLSRNPDVQDEARARVLQAADAGKGPGDPFVLNVVHETMRLFPPVPFSSKISETGSIEVEGVNIPAKTNVMWMKTAVGLNEAFFADAPRFNPRRFAAGPEGERPAKSIVSAMPFGTGARHCIGRHQAEHLLTRFLSAVLREFELVPVHDVAVTFSATVSVTPSSVPVRLVPRQVPSRREAGLEPEIDQRADAAFETQSRSRNRMSGAAQRHALTCNFATDTVNPRGSWCPGAARVAACDAGIQSNRQDHILSNSASWEHIDGQSAHALYPDQTGYGHASRSSGRARSLRVLVHRGPRPFRKGPLCAVRANSQPRRGRHSRALRDHVVRRAINPYLTDFWNDDTLRKVFAGLADMALGELSITDYTGFETFINNHNLSKMGELYQAYDHTVLQIKTRFLPSA